MTPVKIPMLSRRRLLALAASASAAPAQKFPPIPRAQAIPMPYDQISFEFEGRELTRYHYGSALKRPFLYPVNGPSGRTLTRMGHPGDPQGHSHHNSVWFSLNDVEGMNFWGDTTAARIVHKKLEHLEDGDDAALAITEGEWIGDGGRTLLREKRHIVVRPLEEGHWLLILQLDLTSAGSPITLKPALFGPIGVRIAKWAGAFHGGGSLRNSEGATGEPAVFRKRARWADYSGQANPNRHEGITLFDHPSNPHHPSPFHVREDGWMGAMLSMDKPTSIGTSTPLSLRYGLWVHDGVPEPAEIDSMWNRFAKTPLRRAFGPPRSERDCLHGNHKLYTVPREFKSGSECAQLVKSR